MNIQDIAALVAVRNYTVSTLENRNVFKGDTYKAIGAKVKDIDSFLAKAIIDLDLEVVASIPDPSISQRIAEEKAKIAAGNPKGKKKTVKKTSKKAVKKTENVQAAIDEADDEADDEEKRGSQIPLDFNKEDKPVKVAAKRSNDLSDDDDAEMIAKRIAEEKAKLASRKKAK